VSAVKKPDDDAFDWWAVAGQEFRRRIDDHLREEYPNGVLPWERSVAVGKIDYFRAHAYALDRLEELLEHILPVGDVVDETWRGRHDEQSDWITVSLINGEWSDPANKKQGRDIVSLIGHIYGLSQGRAAIELGQWAGVQAVRHE
jgi:hypothetical protein